MICFKIGVYTLYSIMYIIPTNISISMLQGEGLYLPWTYCVLWTSKFFRFILDSVVRKENSVHLYFDSFLPSLLSTRYQRANFTGQRSMHSNSECLQCRLLAWWDGGKLMHLRTEVVTVWRNGPDGTDWNRCDRRDGRIHYDQFLGLFSLFAGYLKMEQDGKKWTAERSKVHWQKMAACHTRGW